MSAGRGASLLNVENNQGLSPKNITEERNRCVKARLTMFSGVARHVMLEGLFPSVKLTRKTAPKTFGAASGEQIRDSRENEVMR